MSDSTINIFIQKTGRKKEALINNVYISNSTHTNAGVFRGKSERRDFVRYRDWRQYSRGQTMIRIRRSCCLLHNEQQMNVTLFCSFLLFCSFIYSFLFFLFSTNTQKTTFLQLLFDYILFCVGFFLSLQYHDLFITLITRRIKLHFFFCVAFSLLSLFISLLSLQSLSTISRYFDAEKSTRRRQREREMSIFV